jgi:hypothetical protein
LVGILGRVIKPVARPLPAHNNTNTRNADRQTWLEWDSNPRFQCLSYRRFSCLRPRGQCDRNPTFISVNKHTFSLSWFPVMIFEPAGYFCIHSTWRSCH